MTEKRFIVAICGNGKLGIRDLTTLNEYSSERQVADYMNRITEENEQLKKNYESLSHNNGLLYDECVGKIENIKKENEQLKEQIKELQIENEAQSDAIDGLQELLTHMDLGDVE